MIGRLRGVLAGRGPGAVVIDVAGVGYEVAVTPRTQAELAGLGEEVVVHTHLQGREDGISLFGFPTETERDLFRVLLTASGVGPKLALGILGSLTAAEIRQAIAREDVDALTVAPGVGKRSAQKLVLELKPKLEQAEAHVVEANSAAAQVRQALEGLGYTPTEIREVAPSLDHELPVALQIREALRLLGRR
ncbi:MAG TPA: Holliday junction branch migration protein RuvA [Acidimicrobiia bacterium]|nr:Holliday junction branch migration protein RuvA [Acidimicrobiia bacterium]